MARPDDGGRSDVELLLVLTVGLLAIVASWPRQVHAHDRTTSYSVWRFRESTADVTARLSDVDVARAGFGGEGDAPRRALGTYVEERLVLLQHDGTPCAPSEPSQVTQGSDGFIAVRYSIVCATGEVGTIRTGLLLDVLPTHLHFARLDYEGAVSERVLTASDVAWNLPQAGTSASTTFVRYVSLGFEHIVSGYDHLVFLLALLLVGGSLLSTAKVVTAFTLAHSLTLAVSVSGVFRPVSAPVEALIGLSIVLLSVENVWLVRPSSLLLPRLVVASLLLLGAVAALGMGRLAAAIPVGLALFSGCYYSLLGRAAKPETVRWAIAFVFGLVHGFGFASVLLDADMSVSSLATGLLGFNVGVEIGQLALILISWPLLRALQSKFGSVAVEAGSAVTVGMGAYWFAGRAFG